MFTLSQIFELRKSDSSHPRKGVGRLFRHQNQWGVSDHTGALWPITFVCSETESPPAPREEAQVIFLARSHSLNSIARSKYLDFPFEIHLELLEVAGSGGFWPKNTPSWLPDALELTQSVEKWQGNPSHPTRYFSTPFAKHFQVQQCRMQLETQVRSFFSQRQYLEVRTPILVPSGGYETYMTPFETTYIDRTGTTHRLQLPTSPEFGLKQLLVQGYPRIFQMAPSFRNRAELGSHHEPEFLMLEWYQLGSHMHQCLQETLELIQSLQSTLGWSRIAALQPSQVSTIKVADLLEETTGIALKEVQDLERFREKAKSKLTMNLSQYTWDDVFSQLFMTHCEPVLQKHPWMVLSHFPIQLGGLALPCPKEPWLAQRFELYSHGVELCNGYQELTCPKTLRARREMAAKLNPSLQANLQFERALEHGLVNCSGNALGLDRLFQILLGQDRVDKVKNTPFLSQFSEEETINWL